MNILMAFNSSYCFPSAVTIGSLLKHNPEPVTIYVIYSLLKKREMEWIEKLVTKSGHGKISFIRVPADAFEGLRLMSWITKETYYRLLAQKLLPESVKRFLWLDSDVLVLRNLHDFYNQDLEGNLLAAASVIEEGTINEGYRKLTLPADTRYFNAGVLLYDLEAQRERIDPEIYEKYIQAFSKQLKFGDQDVLNAVFYKCVKYVDWKNYNLFVRRLNNMSVKERNMRVAEAYILHYNGNSKPWNKDYSQLFGWLFWEYAKEVKDCAGQYEGMRHDHKNARRRFLRKSAKGKKAAQAQKGEKVS